MRESIEPRCTLGGLMLQVAVGTPTMERIRRARRVCLGV
jgi:hypothetical protein